MQQIEHLVKLFSKLPGYGPRSARRAVLYILKKKESFLHPLVNTLIRAGSSIKDCEVCGNIDVRTPCTICTDTTRDETTICVVEDIEDLWALSRCTTFKGKFHVLGGVLSPIDGITPEDLRISSLLQRVAEGGIAEIILATNLTVEGQSTAHYIAEKLYNTDVKITRLAHGVPVGGELEYMDDGTIAAALSARQSLDV